MNFQSTLSLYGVEPKELSKMDYGRALNVKYLGLLKRKKELANDLFECVNYTKAVEIQVDFKKIMKAIDLVKLQIEEIK